MDIEIVPFDTCPDTQAVARLIYQADPSLMKHVFGTEDEAVPIISKLVALDDNEYSGRFVRCAMSGGELVGIAAGLTGVDKREIAKTGGRDWSTALGLWRVLRILPMAGKMEKVATAEVADDEFYLSALTVDERFRGRGVGSKLLESILAEHPKVVTDVNVANDDSLRFYRRHGFKISDELTITHKGERIGNYQIRRAPG